MGPPSSAVHVAGFTDHHREAGLLSVTRLGAVDPVVEGADDGDVRGEGEVVVGPLTENGHQVGVQWVTGQGIGPCVEYLV